jgi:Na+/phosphate symporter
MQFSDEMQETAEKAFGILKQVYGLAIISINDPNVVAYEEINNKKSYMSRLVNQINEAKLSLGTKKDAKLLNYYSLCNDLVDTFARIFYYNRKIARIILTQENKDD